LVEAERTRWRAVGELRDGDPHRIAGFEVVGRLGHGGMGVVYLAEHPEMGPAALKFLHSGRAADETFRARFRREVEAADRVRSPRVAPMLAADPDAETPWLATSFVDGPTLREAVESRGPMEGERITSLAVALADALDAIHRAGVVHRDLKPANILLTAETPVVIDFGIASFREAPALTSTGATIGTPGWMAPEQIRGRRAGPRVDVFAWGLVMAYAGSGRPAFGAGPSEALFYRILHEAPKVPALPAPLDELVRAALTKDPRRRPDVAHLLDTLTLAAQADAHTGSSPTVVGHTLADRTDVVPTMVALGWGVDALPARPNGNGGGPARVGDPGGTSAVPGKTALVAAAAPALDDPPAVAPAGRAGGSGPASPDAATRVAPDAPPKPDAATRVAAAAPRPDGTVAGGSRRGERGGPPFFFAGVDHPDARSLAAAFQTEWDEAANQLFRRRDAVWIAELRNFLRDRKLTDADRIVGAGTGDAPTATTMAQLLVALDPNVDPRIGDLWLTPEGLAEAAQPIADGRDDVRSERLAMVRDAHVLRLWRSLPGMERAAWIDERWHSSLDAFGRLVATASPHAGWPSTTERTRASATLLLCAVHPDHERRLGRQLSQARRTSARHQPWWSQLAAEGEHAPAAAALAVMTVERARVLSQRSRDAAREAAKGDREKDRLRRDAERRQRDAERERRQVADAASRPPEWRYRPLPKAQSATRRTWVLFALLGALFVHLWALDTFGDSLVAHYESGRSGEFAANRLDTYRNVEDDAGLVVLLVLALPAAHVATRTINRQGAKKAVVRAYAAAVAGVDLLLGLVLIAAATVAALVFGAGLDGEVRPGATQPFGEDQPWVVTGLLLPFGLVGVVLVVRSVWRLARAAFGGTVAGPPTAAPAPRPAAAYAGPPPARSA
jgi:serine/threonine protein kinase